MEPGAMTSPQNLMASIGVRLFSNRYPIMPVIPGEKRPGRLVNGTWEGYARWQQHCHRPTRQFEIDIWSKYPGPVSIGVACGYIVAVDIDILDNDLSVKLANLAKEKLGDTPAVRIGRAPKRLLVYRTETPFPSIKRHPLEILGTGAQFVAYGTHPDTGKPYQWIEESLADIDITDLPLVDKARVETFLDDALALIPDDLKPKTLAFPDRPDQAGGAFEGLEGTPEAITEALEFIDNDDLSWDDWKRIGLAIYAALGEAGEPLWHEFSAKSSKNDVKITSLEWSAIRRSPPSRIGAGTIYHLAERAGWRPGVDIHFNPAKAHAAANPITLARPAPVVEISPACQSTEPNPARLNDTTEPAPLRQFPEAGHNVDGLLAQIRDYIVDTAEQPQPELSLAAAITAVGTLAGRKFATPTNLRTNIYAIGVAGSGAGKNHPREMVDHLLTEAGLDKHLGGSEIASGAGLVSAVEAQPSVLFVIDEFGQMLRTIADRRRAPKHQTEILDHLTKFFSNAGGRFRGQEYANKKERPRIEIVNPNVCLFGLTTREPLWGSLSSGSVEDGSLARFLIFAPRIDYPDVRDRIRDRKDIPPGLLEGLQAIAGANAGGNLADLSSATPAPRIAPYAPGVEAIVKAQRQANIDKLRAFDEADRGNFNGIISRTVEHALKLALVSAISADPTNPVIRERDFEWGMTIATYNADLIIAQVEDRVSDSETESQTKTILRWIKKAGSNGILQGELTRKTQAIKKRERDDILDSLVEANVVYREKVEREGAGRPTYRYRAAV